MPDAAALSRLPPAARALVLQYFQRLNSGGWRGDRARGRDRARHDGVRRRFGRDAMIGISPRRFSRFSSAVSILTLAGIAVPVQLARVDGHVDLRIARVAAQVVRVDAEEEGRRLREAAGLEWRGQTDDAERVLMGLLRDYPTSSGGLFALERVLRSRSRVAQVLPFAEAYLAADPRASGVRYMTLRVLVEVDSLAALPAVAEAWFKAEEGSPDPYREVARLYSRAFGDAEALAVLEAGRDALNRSGSEGALAMELGDLRARLDDPEGAVEEWARGLCDGLRLTSD